MVNNYILNLKLVVRRLKDDILLKAEGIIKNEIERRKTNDKQSSANR